MKETTQHQPAAAEISPPVQSGDVKNRQTDYQSADEALRDNGLGSTVTENCYQTRAKDAAKPSGKAGAPVGNSNRRTHGARGVLTMSRGKRGEGHVRQTVYKFRRALEEQARRIHGPLSLNLEGLLLTACRAELAIKLYEAFGRRSDRTELESLEVCEKVLTFSDRRDRCLERLLGKAASTDPADPWLEIDRKPAVAESEAVA